MIWSSVAMMTAIDLLVVGACGYAAWKYYSHRKRVLRPTTGLGGLLITLGLLIFGGFYAADFFAMHLMPFYAPADAAMAFMEALHHKYAWLFTVVGVIALVSGFVTSLSGVSTLIEETRHIHDRFRDVADIASDWIWEMDAELRFTFLSGRFYELTKFAPSDIVGRTREEFAGIDPDDPDWRGHFEDLAARREFRDFKYAIRRPGGAVRHFLINGKPVFAADGTFQGYRGIGSDRTEMVEAQLALEASERQYRNLIEGSIQGLYIHRDGEFLFANQALADILGYATVEEILALGRIEPLLDPEDRDRLWAYNRARCRGEFAPEVYEARGIRKDGSSVWLELRATRTEWRGIVAVQCVVIDISDRKAVEAALKQQNERFNVALDNMSQGLCVFDGDQRLVVCNDRYATMYGLSPGRLRPGMTFREILELRVANGIHAGHSAQDYIDERSAAVVEQAASMKTQELSDGRIISIVHQPTPGGGWLATHEDITEYRRIEERLAHLAHHDALTDLPNRALLRERMDRQLKRVEKGSRLSLLCLDLDGFKSVNDTLGHPAGDELLKHVAARLSRCVRRSDTVARLGGDEFAIIECVPDQPEDFSILAERICEVLSAPFRLGAQEVVIGTSIGIAVAPRDGTDADILMKKADIALYQAKAEGRGRYCFFKPDMESTIKDRQSLGSDLRRALGNGELMLHYQPLIRLDSDAVCGLEALLRWRHPQRGMVSPADFIPVAEETGLINPLGEWVLRQACAQAATWPESIPVAVNVSPVQFRGRQLMNAVVNALAASGLAASRLELEITESVLLRDEETILSMLHELRGLGVRISLDDFGTGYSSLSYLQRFPFDKIKIDASFIGDLDEGSTDEGMGIVPAVISMAARLGVTTVAEGVETEAQLAVLRREGCSEVQGHVFSPALPVEEVTRRFLDKTGRAGYAA